jgi:DNA-directed RNA polymerase subunit RPC12/RpoP
MGENLHICIYERCGKTFDAPVRLTDLSHKPRSETYYACPYCFSKMDESEHDFSHELKLMKNDGYEIETNTKSKKQTTEKEDQKEDISVACPHHVGYLKKRSKDESVPDSCLTCPKILQCMV